MWAARSRETTFHHSGNIARSHFNFLYITRTNPKRYHLKQLWMDSLVAAYERIMLQIRTHKYREKGNTHLNEMYNLVTHSCATWCEVSGFECWFDAADSVWCERRWVVSTRCCIPYTQPSSSMWCYGGKILIKAQCITVLLYISNRSHIYFKDLIHFRYHQYRRNARSWRYDSETGRSYSQLELSSSSKVDRKFRSMLLELLVLTFGPSDSSQIFQFRRVHLRTPISSF